METLFILFKVVFYKKLNGCFIFWEIICCFCLVVNMELKNRMNVSVQHNPPSFCILHT
jgi:hypothetical protein